MNILLFIAVLFVLVIVHECGHFFMAKRMGMRVDEFGVGFPPKLWSRKKGETEYSLNALPIGGFVRIYGEDARGASARLDEDVSEQGEGNSPSSGQRRYGEDAIAVGQDPDASRAFVNRPKWAQSLVLIAGVAANVLFAWLLFTMVLTMGSQTVVEESEATHNANLTVISVLPESPASRAGIVPGDVIVSISHNGESAELVPSRASAFISGQESVTFSVSRDRVPTDITLTPERGLTEEGDDRAVVGVVMGLVEHTSLPIHLAAYESVKITAFGLRDIVVGIATLFFGALTGDADLSQVAGPVGIAGLVGDAASFGFAALVTFTAFISLNLAVINLLPFPALDGGRLLFVGIEAIKGSPIRPAIAYGLNAVGFGLLILLMLVVTYNDILKLF